MKVDSFAATMMVFLILGILFQSFDLFVSAGWPALFIIGSSK